MPSTTPNAFDQVFNQQFIVVHGNKRRAAQSGYPMNQMVEGVSDDVADIVRSVYGDSTSEHGHGNPGFCMSIQVGDFYRYMDGSAGCTVQYCHMNKFPYTSLNGQWPGGDVNGCDYSAGAVGTVPFDSTPYNYRRFPCPFDISAVLIPEGATSTKGLTSVNLLHKGASPEVWDENDIQISKPVTLTAEYGTSYTKKLVLAIIMKSTCNCDQDKKYRPVWAVDISTYIPPVRKYIWRRFGSLAQEQALAKKNGYTISDDWKKLCDGKWHLVRPFYYNKNGKWTSVESERPKGT